MAASSAAFRAIVEAGESLPTARAVPRIPSGAGQSPGPHILISRPERTASRFRLVGMFLLLTMVAAGTGLLCRIAG